MSSILPKGKTQFTDLIGRPLVGGQVFFYAPGTTTKMDTWQDEAMTIPNTNPVILDARGEATIWGEGTYRQMVFQRVLIGGYILIWDTLISSSISDSALAGTGGAGMIGMPDGGTLADKFSLNLNHVVDSIAALRGISHIFYSRAFVTGYYEPHDGGGGAYQYDPDDSTSVDNGGTVIVATDGGRWKLQCFIAVTARQFGAKGDNSTDDTASLQAMLNCDALSWKVPEGKFCFMALTMPGRAGFSFSGEGVSSILVQKGAGISFPALTADCLDAKATIQNLAFDGTLGTANTFDTTYAQTLDLVNLFFNNVPVGQSSLKLDGNPGSGTYMHDVRVRGLRIYSTTAGNAGLVLGAFASDTEICDFSMNGGFVTNYCAYAVTGAQTTKFQGSHIYNAKVNVVHLEGNNGDFAWDNCTLDNALADIFFANSAANGRFTNTFIESIPAGFSGVVLNNSFDFNFIETKFSTATGSAVSCVRETGVSSGNKVIAGQLDNVAAYTTPFDLPGPGSFAKGFKDYNDFDAVYSLQGTAQTAQAQGTQVDYGVNGAGGITNTAWCVPLKGSIINATVFVDTSPAAGQQFVFALLKNGTSIGTGVVGAGAFGVTIVATPGQQFVSTGDQLSIRANFSATSGSASPRYAVALLG